jgi:hypothetical protein
MAKNAGKDTSTISIKELTNKNGRKRKRSG